MACATLTGYRYPDDSAMTSCRLASRCPCLRGDGGGAGAEGIPGLLSSLVLFFQSFMLYGWLFFLLPLLSFSFPRHLYNLFIRCSYLHYFFILRLYHFLRFQLHQLLSHYVPSPPSSQLSLSSSSPSSSSSSSAYAHVITFFHPLYHLHCYYFHHPFPFTIFSSPSPPFIFITFTLITISTFITVTS